MDIRPLTNTAQNTSVYSDKALQTASASTPAPLKPVAEPTQPVAAVQQPSANPSAFQVSEALKSINKAMQSMSQNVEFAIDEDTDRAIVKVVDMETKEIIRQMPSKEVLEIAKALDKVQGLLIRQQA